MACTELHVLRQNSTTHEQLRSSQSCNHPWMRIYPWNWKQSYKEMACEI